MDFIEVSYKSGAVDPQGAEAKAKVRDDLFIKGVGSVSCADVYYFQGAFTSKELKFIAEELLADPINQDYRINSRFGKGFDWVIEVKYHDDVTDNTGIAAVEGVQDILGRKLGEGESIRTARKYMFKGKIPRESAEKIASMALANELIETYSVKRPGK